jgi:protein KRI1
MGKQKSSNGDGTRLLDSDSEDEGLLQINKKYAVRFEEKERKNELQRARALGIGEDNGEEEDSEDDESEDEDAEQLSSALDLQIVRTINSIKRRDPAIYETGKVWFEKPPASDDDEDDGDGDGDVGEERASGKSSRRATYKDVIRSQLLLSGADVEGGTDVEDAKRSKKQSSLSYNTEQERLRQAFLKSARHDEDEDEDEDVLVVKKKSTAEQEQEESELQTALIELKTLTEKQLSKEAKRIEKKKAKAGDSSSSSSSSSSLSHQENKDKARSQGKEEQRDGGSFFSGASSFDPRVVPAEDREKFLLDYMAKKQWVMPKVRYSDREYRDSSALSLLGPHDRDVVDLDEDAEEVERMDAFESKYNFRFEEVGDAPGGLSQVVGHSRTIPGLVRREDDKRKQQRAAREEAKARERRIKEEEIKRLKNLKRQELRHRLEKIAKLGGLDLGELEAAAEEEEEPSGNAKSKSKGKGKGKGGNDKACRSKALKVNVGDLDEDWDPAAHDRLMTAQFDDSYYEQEDDGFDAGDADPELEQEVGGYAYEDEDDGQGEGEGAYAGGAIAKAAAAAGKGKAAAKTVKMLAQAEQEGQVGRALILCFSSRSLNNTAIEPVRDSA